MDLSYSGRFSLWKTLLPGVRRVCPAASTVYSSASTSVNKVSADGRRTPGGGIIPTRSFMIIFSLVGANSAAIPTLKSSKDKLPRNLRLL